MLWNIMISWTYNKGPIWLFDTPSEMMVLFRINFKENVAVDLPVKSNDGQKIALWSR